MDSLITVRQEEVLGWLNQLKESFLSGEVRAEAVEESCRQAFRISGRFQSLDVRPLSDVRREAESDEIIVALNVTRGHRREAARMLEVNPGTLRRKITDYGLTTDFPRLRKRSLRLTNSRNGDPFTI